MEIGKSCYDVLEIDENACTYDIREAYVRKKTTCKNPLDAVELAEMFQAYTLAMELCMYKPFFETTCDDVSELMDSRDKLTVPH